MQSGTVKRVESERGFGFIADASGTEYFFHRTAIADFDSLRGGESVTFDEEEGPKGKRANNVRVGVAEAPAPAAEAPAEEAPAPAAEEPAPAAEAGAPAGDDAEGSQG
jgi:CspA family cold shock protein